MANPFEPTFGRTPPLLVGRDVVIAEVAESFERVGGAALATLVTGARGSGKTVLLNAFEDTARSQGWIVFSEAATPGLINRLIVDRLIPLLDDLDGDRPVELRSLSGMGFGASWERGNRHGDEIRPGFRPLMEAVTDRLAAQGVGLLVSVDEVHRSAIKDLRELTTAVQHGFREERPMALVAAGLPSAVSDLLNDDVLTFLRRAHRVELGPVTPDDVALGLARPLDDAGRKITTNALRHAVTATEGYPFMIQLVGDELYRSTTDVVINVDAANRAIPTAARRLGCLVHETALADLSVIDRSVLVAMAHDEGPSRMGDIATRLGVNANYASQYRLRLLAAGVIRSAGHGLVDFELPYLRDYLQEHATLTLPDAAAGQDRTEPPSP
jgi:hypothetical protein